MNLIHYVLSVAWKELQLIGKDRGALGVYFLLPLLIGSLVSAPAAMAIKAAEAGEAAVLLKVGLVNADDGAFGAEIAKAIQAIQELEVTPFNVASEAESQVAQGNLAAAILLPAGFSRQIDAYQPTEITVLVDPAQPEGASIVSGIMNQVVSEAVIWGEVQHGIQAVLDRSGLLAGATEDQQRGVAAQSQGVIMTRLQEIRRSPSISVVSEDLTGAKQKLNGALIFIAYTFAGFTVMFIFFIVGSMAKSLLDEREIGVLRRVAAAPIPRGAMIAGKMLAYLLIVCLQAVVLFGVARILFGMHLGRSPAGLAALTLAVGLSATSLGVLLAAVSKTPRQADSLGTLLGFVLAALGGAVAIGQGMMFFQAGGLMGFLSKLTPQGHAMKGFYGLLVEDATFVQILPQIGALLGMSAIFFLIARWRFRFVG